MKNILKYNWKNILLVILIIFSLTKCTQSCNRGISLSNKDNEIRKKDSIINIREHFIDSLVIENNHKEEIISQLEKSNENLVNFTDNQRKIMTDTNVKIGLISNELKNINKEYDRQEN